MNISYSYYNRESDNNYLIDPEDDLYNLAVAINNKNAHQLTDNGGSPLPYKLNKPVCNNTRNDSLFRSPYPFYNVQGQYSSILEDSDSENISFPDLSVERSYDNDSYMSTLQKHKKYKRKYSKGRHLDDSSSEEISEGEKLDHIKECGHCKKIFLDIIKNRNNKHVFDESTNLNQSAPSLPPIIVPSQAQQLQLQQIQQQMQQIQQIQQMQQLQQNRRHNLTNNQNDNNRIDNYQTIQSDQPNQAITNNLPANIFSKEVILVLLVGVAIILFLDILSITGRRR